VWTSGSTSQKEKTLQTSRLFRAITLTLVLGISSIAAVVTAPASQAQTMHAATQVTKSGTFEKAISAMAFKMAVGMKSYEVKTDSMTHVMFGGKTAKVSALKKGDKVTVKGELEMGTIVATSLMAGM
jgi:Domain of unknown function (DUF5666)